MLQLHSEEWGKKRKKQVLSCGASMWKHPETKQFDYVCVCVCETHQRFPDILTAAQTIFTSPELSFAADKGHSLWFPANKCLSENVPADKIKGREPWSSCGSWQRDGSGWEKVTGVNYKKYLASVWRRDSGLARWWRDKRETGWQADGGRCDFSSNSKEQTDLRSHAGAEAKA